MASCADRFHAPIDALLAAGRNCDRLLQLFRPFERIAREFQLHLHLFFIWQVIVDVGRKNNFVAFDKEARRLQPHDEVLAGDNFGRSFTDTCAVAHSPGANFPGGEILGHIQLDFRKTLGIGLQCPRPERRVGKLLSQDGLHSFGNCRLLKGSANVVERLSIRNCRRRGRHFQACP